MSACLLHRYAGEKFKVSIFRGCNFAIIIHFTLHICIVSGKKGKVKKETDTYRELSKNFKM